MIDKTVMVEIIDHLHCQQLSVWEVDGKKFKV